MIIYLAKFILCSALFFVAYLFLLEKEKAHQFKRFYLLASLFLALIIPLLTFYNATPIIKQGTETYLRQYSAEPVPLTSAKFLPTQEINILPYAIMGIYSGICLLLFLRFLRNMNALLSQIRRSEKESWQGATLILNEKSSTPYSFINYIFIGKADYENNQIANEILLHELTHVKQRHSLDVILVELMQIFLWFNPMLYFYRQAIQTNHEYLADESVIKTSNDISKYQLILLKHISAQSGLLLTSEFNYLTIKKRLTMMSKTNSMKAVLGKQLLLIPVLGIALLTFSTKIVAQQQTPKVDKPILTSTNEGISEELMSKYKAIEDKYLIQLKDGKHKTWSNKEMTSKEKALLENLYLSMSKVQQTKTTFAFIKRPKPLPATVPTSNQFEKLKDKSVYGVWIDEKKVTNEDLQNYKAEDFKQVFISKLYGKAREGRIYKYQADLMTKKYYDDYYAKSIAQSHKYMMVTHNYAKLSQ